MEVIMILTKTFRFLITILLLAEGNLVCAGITGDDLINKILGTTVKLYDLLGTNSQIKLSHDIL